MALKIKKYPLLISTIISCVIIIASLFVLGFKGINLGVSLGGGTQIEVSMKDGILTSTYTDKVSDVLKNYDMSIDTNFVEDKYSAGENNAEFNRKNLVIQVAKSVDDETSSKVKTDIATALSVSEENVKIGTIKSSVVSKSVLLLAAAFGIIAICFFVFGFARYDVFAGISFVIAFLHNIILYLSLVIVTRIQLTLSALSAVMFLTLVMTIVLVSIYERFREVSKEKDSAKLSVSEKMINSEKEIIKPFSIIAVAILIFALALLFMPVSRVMIISINMLIALVVTLYTSLLIGPSSYVALLDIREMNRKAVLSRNENVNKVIKKKVQKNKKKNK